mmetsp:Transcript_64211/g.101829  ORF Transcript_64211/g.101829 Transcript_64211/m.101829 type:complete len:91 (+) Transcript_64211:692-964(+)
MYNCPLVMAVAQVQLQNGFPKKRRKSTAKMPRSSTQWFDRSPQALARTIARILSSTLAMLVTRTGKKSFESEAASLQSRVSLASPGFGDS